MNAKQMTLRLAGDTAYLVATPPASLFSTFDDNGDGTLSAREVQRRRANLLAAFDAALRLVDERGRRGEVIFQDVATAHHHGSEPHLRITFRYRWDTPPANLALSYADAERAPLRLSAQRARAARQLGDQVPVGPVFRRTLALPERVVLFGGER
ncbi:MAG: hypothetical protein AAGF12_16830 [Myxococcota bacterium]